MSEEEILTVLRNWQYQAPERVHQALDEAAERQMWDVLEPFGIGPVTDNDKE